ncbi:MAG: hypothetical protein GTN70_05070 [Deltaproteobacteria bacterium]|nr:hypothetical protein [Deltaproteobacteria bacterium]NIS77049.1 hypothetical protein [Deltaproteobacteria bacterium]
MKLVVDGYNLLFHLGLSRGENLEEAREELLAMLSEYGKLKKLSILVVFDGKRGTPGGAVAKKWVKAVFTSPPESADDRIARLAKSLREGAFVVTSDAGLIARITPFNSTYVRVDEFAGKVEQAHYFSTKGVPEEEEVGKEKKPTKGASRRLPKKKRMQKRNLEKL